MSISRITVDKTECLKHFETINWKWKPIIILKLLKIMNTILNLTQKRNSNNHDYGNEATKSRTNKLNNSTIQQTTSSICAAVHSKKLIRI